MPIDLLINIALALMMFNIGTSLSFDSFRNIKQYKKPISVGIALQMIGLPLLSLIVLSFIDLDPDYKFGIFILSICPGGSTSNFVSYLVKSDVSLSVMLTGINSLLMLVSVPILVSFGSVYFYPSHESISLGTESLFLKTVANIFLITLVPVFFGLLLRNYKNTIATFIEKPLKYISIVFLFIVFAVKIFADKNQGGSGIESAVVIQLLIPLLLIHFISLVVGYFTSKRLMIDERKSITIGIEVGLQNTALAILVATVLIGNEAIGQPAIIYSGFSFFTTFIFGWWKMKKLS